MAMKKMMQLTTIIAKPAAVLLQLTLLVALLSCVLPSSASRIVVPESGNDAPTNVSNHKMLLASHLVAKSGTGVVVIPQASKNDTASIQECSPYCNDAACGRYYKWICKDQDPNKCKGACDCPTRTCYCFCIE